MDVVDYIFMSMLMFKWKFVEEGISFSDIYLLVRMN